MQNHIPCDLILSNEFEAVSCVQIDGSYHNGTYLVLRDQTRY